MSAPYFLVNILARGAWTEALGQGILPVVLYYNFRCYSSPGVKNIPALAISYFILATTHLISFIYSGIFIGALFLIIFIGQKDFRRPFKIIKLAAGITLGALLATYFYGLLYSGLF